MAISLSGSGQYLTESTAIVTSFPLTFACWFNPTSNAGSYALISISRNVSTSDYFLLYASAGKLFARAQASGVGSAAVSSASLTIGAWHHCVAVFASATSRVVYLNGIAASNATPITPANLNVTSIGTVFSGGPTALDLANGSIAYLAIWNIALTALDVASLYNSGAGIDPRVVNLPGMRSMLLLAGATPYTDLILPSTTWTQVGSNPIVGDPFLVGPPTLTAPFSTSVGINSATLNGIITVDGGSPSTTTGFNYGTTPAYGLQISTGQVIDTGPFSNSLSGLLTTTYHYQAFATNAAGTGVSTDAIFQTEFSSTGGTPTTPVVVPVTPIPVGQFPIEGPDIGTSLTIWNASLLDYCNPAVKKDQAFVAICQALDPQLKAFLAEIINVIILSNISNQPESVLDFLALYHFNVDYYDTTLPKSTKLLLIQNVIHDKISKGTPQRIIDLINEVFAFGELIEWFNDSPVGIPNTFRIQIADPLTDPVKVANLFRAILVAKNVRSYFAGISSFQSASFQNWLTVGAVEYDYQVIAFH